MGERQREAGAALPEKMVFVFETKCSQSDFGATFRRDREVRGDRKTPIANLHYLIISRDVNPVGLPPFWGVLQESGRGLNQVKAAAFQELSTERLYHAGFRTLLATRRNHERELEIRY
jgi:hypothetical protein